MPDSLTAAVGEDYGAFVRSQAANLVGRRLDVDIKRADGTDVRTELVISIFDHPLAGPVVVGILRAPRREEAAALVGADERAARDPRRRPDRRASGRAAPLDPGPAPRLGRDDAVGGLGRPGAGLPARVDAHARHRPRLRAGEGGRSDQRERGPPPLGPGARRAPVGRRPRSTDQRFVTDALVEDGLQSAYAFPVRYHGACVGIVKMLSRHPRERDPSVVELMDAVGDHLGELLHASAQATERQQLVEELLEARRRNEFLLLATQVLSEVVDYREMVERLAQVSVPVMADLCLIDIEDEDGQMRRMAAWHADPDKRALTEELRASYPPDPGGVHPTMEVMRSGRSMWSADMDDEFLRSTSRDERHYAILKTLDFTSYVTVPLRLRDEQVLGTVTLVSAGSGRRFSEKDLGLAEQLAEQVSSVVIRARAYDRERRISHELQRHLLPDAIPPSSAGTWPPATGRPPSASRSAATGTTWSRSASTSSPSSSATWRATTSGRRGS